MGPHQEQLSSREFFPYTLVLAMFSVSEYNFAYYLIYKNRATYFTNTDWFAQYYFTYIIYMCIHTHTYEYTYMYSINSSVYYDVRDSIPIHTYMTILSLIYTYIYVYMYMYIYMYLYIHTHIHILIFYDCIMHVHIDMSSGVLPAIFCTKSCMSTDSSPRFHLDEVVPGGVLPAISGM